MDYLIITILILFSGLFSGLTIGFLGLNKSELQRKIKIGDKKARKIYNVRKNGNLLLVTLLLGNVMVNSILSVFLGDLFSGLVAVLVSTALIVIFGEIIPQAIFYRHAMTIGYYFVPIINFFNFILYPITKPASLVLDKFLGEEQGTIWSKKELKEIIKDHEDSLDSELDEDEENIVIGALTFSDKKVKEIMTPKNVVYRVEENRNLDNELLTKIKKNGFTRIPVYREDDDKIVGVLNVKSLINLKEGRRVYDLYDRNKIFSINEEDKLDKLMNKFITRKSHIAYVKNIHGTFLGLVTMEDVIEEIINREIVDETDNYEDMRKESKRKNK